FPEMLFVPATPHWNENTVLVLSLSKLGLPGLRTGIVVVSEAVVRDYSRAMTILSLACGSVGPALGVELLRDGALLRLSREAIRPFYAAKAERTLDALRKALAGLPVRIHKPEGAMFLWLWFEGLPGGSRALYEQLKKEGVLVVPGEGFFMGLAEPWAHSAECLRLSYAQPDALVAKGVGIIGRVTRAAYGG
ncbi:MAG: aminotransferase class I/II-fold pyridoxal phosphate-dependent enzyme, partial [Gammaproteobacteria bacterium]